MGHRGAAGLLTCGHAWAAISSARGGLRTFSINVPSGQLSVRNSASGTKCTERLCAITRAEKSGSASYESVVTYTALAPTVSAVSTDHAAYSAVEGKRRPSAMKRPPVRICRETYVPSSGRPARAEASTRA